MLSLHASLAQTGEPFRLHVLCFDEVTLAAVRGIAQASLIGIGVDELLAADPEYAAVRASRSQVEFYFTTTPVLVRHCLRQNPDADRMTYLDADLYFFGPASIAFTVQGDASVGIVPHRFPPHLTDRLKYGTYNVAWVSFRRDRDGLACLEWWRERCLEWCHDYLEAGRFADQGYLDEFPRRFAGVRVVDHPGINAAPWNMRGVAISRQKALVRVNGEPLVFYHFQGVREVVPGWFEPGVRAYGTPLTPALREEIYLPYLRTLAAFERELQQRHGIEPQFRHQRLHAGASRRDRWERWKERWVLPTYGRLRARLLHAQPERARGLRLVVVTPTLGNSRWLDETVESVSRHAPGAVHVLVAPLSACATLKREFPSLRVVPEPEGRAGMYAAINAGLAAVPDWGAFTYINDDDLLLEGFQEVLGRVRVGQAMVVYGGVRLIDTDGRRIGAIPTSPFPSLNRDLYALRTEPVFQHGTVATRAVVEQLGAFDTSLRFCGDSEFLSRACVAKIPFVCATKGVVAAFRLRAGQLTKNLPVMLEEHHRVYNKHRLPAERVTWRHRWARFVFRVVNLPVYAERIARHGFITFGEQLAKGE
jgi:hypothetical protein